MERTPLEDWVVQKTGINERDKKALRAYQLNRLKETIGYAKENSIFYGKHLRNIRGSSIISMRDFANVPFTLPENIYENPLKFLCVPPKEVVRIVTLNTSGTSGATKRIYFTEKDIEHIIEFFNVGMSCLTDKTDSVLVLLPGNAYGSIGDLLKKALALSGIECVVHGVLTDQEEVARCIEERGITCIVGIPIQVLRLSRTKGGTFGKNIKKVLLTTDYVPEAVVYELTHKHGCSVFNHYGMTEMGYGGGVECGALDGYHLREVDLYFEIIDPDSGKPVADETYGEVVFTTLRRHAMPLIRYRTGDIASFSKESCPCGTFLNTMKKVLGRMENRICVHGNRVLHLRELEETILSFEEVLDYKAFLEKSGALRLVLTTENGAGYLKVKDEVSAAMEHLLRRKGIDCPDLVILSDMGRKPVKGKNSMIKRKIIDYRGGEIES